MNPDSEEILELGTREHPYKSINMVMHELFNFVSVLDREVHIKLCKIKLILTFIASISIHEFLHGDSFIYNMTKVVFEPYDINLKKVSSGEKEYGNFPLTYFSN